MDNPPPSATAQRLALVATVLAAAGVWALIEWRSAPPPPPKVQLPYPASTPAAP